MCGEITFIVNNMNDFVKFYKIFIANLKFCVRRSKSAKTGATNQNSYMRWPIFANMGSGSSVVISSSTGSS